MKSTSNATDIIRKWERLYLKAYLCPAGIWTIGYGHTRGVKKGDTCTQSQAIAWLKEDVSSAENDVNSCRLPFTQNQFDALVSFVFNVGGDKFLASTLLRLAKANVNDVKIAAEFAKWKFAKGVSLPGLVSRRKDEASLYFKRP